MFNKENRGGFGSLLKNLVSGGSNFELNETHKTRRSGGVSRKRTIEFDRPPSYAETGSANSPQRYRMTEKTKFGPGGNIINQTHQLKTLGDEPVRSTDEELVPNVMKSHHVSTTLSSISPRSNPRPNHHPTEPVPFRIEENTIANQRLIKYLRSRDDVIEVQPLTFATLKQHIIYHTNDLQAQSIYHKETWFGDAEDTRELMSQAKKVVKDIQAVHDQASSHAGTPAIEGKRYTGRVLTIQHDNGASPTHRWEMVDAEGNVSFRPSGLVVV